MREVVQYATYLIGLPLELLIIATLLRGPYRRFPLLLLYSIALFLTTVIELAANQARFAGIRLGYSYATYYWTDEGIRQALLFGVVLNLAYLATSDLRSRRLINTCLIAGGIAFAGVSLLVHHQDHLAAGVGKWRWMTLWVRDVDFTAAIVDLGLWALLLVSRHRDTQLLLLSGALGIKFTGEAIGQSLRFLLRRWNFGVSPGDLVVLITSLAALWLFWQALRPVPVPRRAEVVAPPPRNGTGIRYRDKRL
ncbi:MAG: hypothetical protein JOZ22_05870 [Acidobacteriia bacterium]|nr:hypothetical protein [Terriglobia bacterium]